jgi:hypothetical protein
MKTDEQAQLVILANALSDIVDIATAQSNKLTSSSEFVVRIGDIAVGALTAAATYGQLPPFPTRAESQGPQRSLILK